MEGITRYLTTKLKLKVNQAKSAVALPKERKFLGFSFTGRRETETTHCAKSDLAVQGADSRTNVSDTRDQYGAASARALCVPAWMARLLWLLPNTFGATRS
jgi:hypothetical protein